MGRPHTLPVVKGPSLGRMLGDAESRESVELEKLEKGEFYFIFPFHWRKTNVSFFSVYVQRLSLEWAQLWADGLS